MAGWKMAVVAEVAVGGRIMAAMFLNGNGLAGPTSIRASRCPCLGLRLQPNSAIALLAGSMILPTQTRPRSGRSGPFRKRTG